MGANIEILSIWLMTLAFVTLKLVGYIDWSWWWVFAPIWISFGLMLTIIIILVVIVGAVALATS